MDWHQNCCNPEKHKLETKIMHKESGFSIIEMLIVIAVAAVIAAIAVPNMLGSRSAAKMRGAVENLKGDLRLAKLKAVQENRFVAVSFAGTWYWVFTDDGPTQEGQYHEIDGERRFRNQELPAGVSINTGSTDFAGNDYVRFNNRGLPENTGKVVVDSLSGDQRTIELNRLGRINIY
jgi:type IV fimbrial biogenesis protein FimT